VKREHFDHVIGAAAEIAGLDEFVVVGSQAILGTHPDPPHALLESMEVDLYPRNAPEKGNEVEGTLGDGSQFHSQFGYYAPRRRTRNRESAGGLGKPPHPGRGPRASRVQPLPDRLLPRAARPRARQDGPR